MNFIFYSHATFEAWDWNNPVTQGIGGSETSHIEMSWRMARRGHTVRSYSPTSWGDEREWRGVRWKSFDLADFDEPGIWVMYRCPSELDKLPKHSGQEVWFVAQDTFYPDWTPARAEKVDRVICLSDDHVIYTRALYPYLAHKVCRSANGINLDLIREMEVKAPERDPLRLLWTSSPDRGLEYMIPIFKRARQHVPSLKLDIYYGFDNIDKLSHLSAKVRAHKKKVLEMASGPGVAFHGRVPQPQLVWEWLKAGIWCYPTKFTETSCITSMESQALGAFPITNPIWALRDNVMHGTLIEGDPYEDCLTQLRYVKEIIRYATDPPDRQQMMKDARYQFNWERVVDTWEAWALRISPECCFTTQFAFQLKHASGRILNVGCDTDAANLKHLGAVNLDITHSDPFTGSEKKVDVIGDARALPQDLKGRFDTVVLGDILEHFTPPDAIKALREAGSALHNGGRVVVTCPNDHRPPERVQLYEGGGFAYHEHPVEREDILGWIQEAGLKADLVEEIDYSHFKGWGIVCSHASL